MLKRGANRLEGGMHRVGADRAHASNHPEEAKAKVSRALVILSNFLRRPLHFSIFHRELHCPRHPRRHHRGFSLRHRRV